MEKKIFLFDENMNYDLLLIILLGEWIVEKIYFVFYFFDKVDFIFSNGLMIR